MATLSGAALTLAAESGGARQGRGGLTSFLYLVFSLGLLSVVGITCCASHGTGKSG